MNRRDFMKTSATAAVATPALAITPVLGKAPIKLFATTPKTVEDLYTAINMMFESKGEFNTQYCEVEYLPVGTARVYFKTYYSQNTKELGPNEMVFKPEGFDISIDSYYSNPVDPVVALWEMVLDFKADIRNNWTMEQKMDFEDRGVKQGSMVWWRMRPQLIETKNGLFTVCMRAEFA